LKNWHFFSSVFRDVATFITVLSYSRGWHGTIMNTQNCIIPVYAPFYDIDCIKVLLETDYNIKRQYKIQKQIITDANPLVSYIMTTHGYNANIKSDNFLDSVKERGKDLFRPLIYYSTPLTHLRRRLEKYIYPAVNINEHEYTFWEKYILESYSDNMEIFSFAFDYNPVHNKIDRSGNCCH